MPPGGGGGGGGGEGSKHGRTEQHHPPATGRRDEGAPSLPTPSLPAIAPAASQKRKQRQPAAASLPEGPLVEILSRVPYRSLCRFRCVSKQWLALCSDTDIVKRAPQTLAGFFHSHDGELRFSNLSGGGTPLVDPSSFPFLWCSRYYSFQLDQCSSSSLLLCKCWGLEDEQDDDDKGEYVVCNPITGQWTTLPPILCQDDEDDDPEYYELVDPFLGFDPAVPSRFVVLARLVESVDHVAVFSSETGQWARSSGWEHRGWYPAVAAECVFLNGMLHFMHLLLDKLSIAAVDTHGKVCREIPLPEGMKGDGSGYGSVGCSQGLLHAWFMDRYHYQLSVWVLEDYCSGAWTLKHTVDVPKLFGRESNKEDCDEEDCGEDDETYNYEMFAIHPERNLIFLTDWKEVNLSYHMDSGEVHHMGTSGDFLGGLPYIPCFADLPDV